MCKRILYLQYANPAAYPPLQHSAKIFADQACKILFFGIDVKGLEKLELPSHPNIKIKKIGSCPPGFFQKLHYLWYGILTLLEAVSFKPTHIYLSDPLVCPVGLVLMKILRAVYIYHEHDTPDASAQKGASLFMKSIMKARRKVAREASFCILPNQSRINEFIKQTHRNSGIFCVWNCPSAEEAAPRLPMPRKGPLTVVYQGSVVPERLPLAVLQALSQFPGSVRLLIIGYETLGHTGYVKKLEEEAKRVGVYDQIDILGPLPRAEMLSRCFSFADVGLAFMPVDSADINMKCMVGASNKPFDYLACGLALIVTDLPDWKRMFVENGYGLSCNPEDPKSIAAVLRRFVDYPGDRRKMGELGREMIIREWNYEKQFAGLCEKIFEAKAL